MPKRPIPVPDDVAELAALVIAAKSRGDMGDEDLAKAISYAILVDRVRRETVKRPPGRPSLPSEHHLARNRITAKRYYDRLKRQDPERFREMCARNYMRLRADPKRWRKHQMQSAANTRKRRAANLEAARERERLCRQRRRERDPEAFAIRQRECNRRAKAKIPEDVRRAYSRRKSRKDTARRVPEKFKQAALATIPKRVPKHIAEDIVQSILASALNGDFCLRDVPGVTAKRVRDFWFAQRRNKTASLDQAVFNDGRRTLHEMIAG